MFLKARNLMEDGQTTLELTAALIILMMFLVASARIFVWLNERIVYRQHQYETTRVAAGSAPFTSYVDLANQEHVRGLEPDESTNPALNIFR